MLFLLSPAKALDYETPLPPDLAHSTPCFLAEAAALIELLRSRSQQQLAELMGLSDALAALNAARYRDWSARTDLPAARQALLAFDGALYQGLQARTLDAAALDWAQQHVLILSGLYGLLRPLDRIEPHRLEMGTRLANPAGANLYAWWGRKIAAHLNGVLSAHSMPVLVNLASQEYARALDRKALKARVIDCVFEDGKDGGYKVMGLYAKRARGLMLRHAIEQRVTAPHGLRDFAREGYAFAPSASLPERLVFRRKKPPPSPANTTTAPEGSP